MNLADVSEFQPNIDGDAYLKGGYSCIIVRAHNGYRPDNIWPARRDYLRNRPFTAIGWYQYLAHDRDAATQAREFRDCIGHLQANEFCVCDCEEGSGDQTSRVTAWFGVIDPWQGFPATLYAGESFGNSNLGGWSRWKRPRWIAAYRSSEPTEPHELWQNTDHQSFPGIPSPCDGNVFHGSAQDFTRIFRGGAQPVPPPSPPPTPAPLMNEDSIAYGVMKDGRLEVFVEASNGTIWHTWNAKGGGWEDKWYSLGTPGKQ